MPTEPTARPLADHLAQMYQDCVDGTLEPDGFVRFLREEMRRPMSGIARIHGAGLVINDINVGSVLFGKVGDSGEPSHGILIDFGYAGTAGDFIKPGTLGTTAPERIESSDDPSAAPTGRNEPASKEADAYALGCVLHYMVHGHYPSWNAQAQQAPTQDQQMIELSVAAADESRGRSPLPPVREETAMADLRTASPREKALRQALVDAGFYAVQAGLTQLRTDRRMTVEEALNAPFFASATR